MRSLIVAVLLGSSVLTGRAAAEQPSVVLFLVDDLGPRDLGVTGSTLHQTPHFDALAAAGVRFDRAYAAYPRCVPSRVGLLSGKFPARIEALPRSERGPHPLPPDEVTFGEALQAAGYDTGYIGKWHLGHEADDRHPAAGPGEQGFGTVVHAGSAGATASHYAPFGIEKGHAVANPVDGEPGDSLTAKLTDAAVDFIARERDAPFLLVLSHYAVHTPLETTDDRERANKRELRRAGLEVGNRRDDPDLVADRRAMVKSQQNNPVYAGMVEEVDESLGRVIAAIEAAGQTESTLVIATSDHGGLAARGPDSRRPLATSNAPLRQGKGSILEGGIRVPLIVRWPGRAAAGTVSLTNVAGTDHYPTLLAAAGVPLQPGQHVDGRSYLPSLDGSTQRRDPMLWHKWTARPGSTGDERATVVIDGTDKLVRWLSDDEPPLLFDLAADEAESHNLAGERPDRVSELAVVADAFVEAIDPNGRLIPQGREMMDKRRERKSQPKSTK